ncbi:AEX-3 domain-containing protein [Phycomyces nitens]|nr:AEX-3 domain-containing protein [Phycomyces nitens]
MATSLIPVTRLADYFFVAGLHDDKLISTYEDAKKGDPIGADDVYYDQQKQAAATDTSHALLTNSPPPQAHVRPRGMSSPLEYNDPTDSFIDVLDHVQSVIDTFGKDRDSARDVIAVHKGASNKSEPTSTVSRHTSGVRRQSARQRSLRYSKTWRSISDSNAKGDPGSTRPRSVSLHQSISSTSEPVPVVPEPVPKPTESPKPIIPNLLEIKYIPNVLSRYPKQDYSVNEQFPAYVAMFCFPKDISLHYGKDPPAEQTHSFAMTDENGRSIYGTCVVFYEPLSSKLYNPVNKAIQEWIQANMSASTIEYAQHLQGKISEEQHQLEEHGAILATLATLTTTPEIQAEREILEEKVRTSQENLALYSELLVPVRMGICEAKQIWVPKCVGVLGGMPWMDLLGDWIRILVDAVVGVRGHKHENSAINIESAVFNLIREVPLPSPGRFETRLTINHRSLFFSRPAINQVPVLKNFSLFPLFRTLSPHLVLVVIETLLSEGKVLFLSKCAGMLSLAAESFRYLLFPFYWQFVFIPVLPEKLLTCLQAPVPYIIGYQGEMDALEEYLPDDVCIVNLDANTMHQSQPPMPLPTRARRKLQSSLEQYAPLHTRFKVPYGVPLSILETFPNGRLLLNCGRSKTQDVFVSPAQRRDSESSDGYSLMSHPASTNSKPISGFWSSNNSTRSSNDSATSLPYGIEMPTPSLPQFPNFAKLAITTQSSTSSPAPHSPVVSSPQLVPQRSTPSPGRSSLPTQGANFQKETGDDNRRSGPPQFKSKNNNQNSNNNQAKYTENNTQEGSGIRRLSALMSKPRAAFQQGNYDTTETPSAYNSSHLTVPKEFESFSNLDSLQPNHEIMRRVKHIEGHTMIEMLRQELSSFHGHRCLCGQQIGEENIGGLQRQSVFMYCQDCHLVTHAVCTSQILHPCLPACFDEAKIQASFLRMFASLLCHYRSGIVDGVQEHGGNGFTASFVEYSVDKNGVLFFSKDKFLKQSDKDTRVFLSNLANSQMFNQFITDRLAKSCKDPEILMFDEYIKLKLNRSKLKFVKESTPFLNDDSYRVSQTVRASSPDDIRHGCPCKLIEKQ